jgi:hypothetical protein
MLRPKRNFRRRQGAGDAERDPQLTDMELRMDLELRTDTRTWS